MTKCLKTHKKASQMWPTFKNQQSLPGLAAALKSQSAYGSDH